VQGRKAFQSILEAIESDTFPTQVDRALEQYFRHSPLVRARPTLIKDVIAVLTKHLLLEQLPEAERLRKFAALLAVFEMYRQEGERILQEELPKIVLRVLTHVQLANLLVYLQRIPFAWYALGDPGRDKARYFLESGPDDQMVAILPVALEIPALRKAACQRLAALSDDDLTHLIEQDSSLLVYFFSAALERWRQSESFEESKMLDETVSRPISLSGPDS